MLFRSIKYYLSDFKKFYTYTIKDKERADIIAYSEYGDSTLDWVIYIINDINDPYYDWPMDNQNFISYLETKYNTNAYKLTSTLTGDTIHHYYYQGLDSDSQEDINSYNYTMTYETYMALGQPPGWTAVSIWDYENNLKIGRAHV